MAIPITLSGFESTFDAELLPDPAGSRRRETRSHLPADAASSRAVLRPAEPGTHQEVTQGCTCRFAVFTNSIADPKDSLRGPLGNHT